MFAKFNYSPSGAFYNSVINHYYTIGVDLFTSHEKEVQGCLAKYITEDGIINGTELKERWFSITPKDIFISHSHNDLNRVKAFLYNSSRASSETLIGRLFQFSFHFERAVSVNVIISPIAFFTS